MRALLAVLVLFASAAWGQQYPAKPVRLLVGFAPGGGTDLVARLMAAKLSERWNQAVVVENKLGASGNIAAEQVAKSAPDGYTLLMIFSSHASNAAVMKMPFDINKDFSAITLVGSGPAVVLANPQLTGIEMVHVPYKGIALAMTAILAGDIQITYATPISAYAHLKSGRLKALAVAGPSRYPTMPDVPTAAEAGLADYEIEFWYGLVGPAGMPSVLVDRIQRDISGIVNAPEMKQQLLEQGAIGIGSKPQELDALIRKEYARWLRVVQRGNIKID